MKKIIVLMIVGLMILPIVAGYNIYNGYVIEGDILSGDGNILHSGVFTLKYDSENDVYHFYKDGSFVGSEFGSEVSRSIETNKWETLSITNGDITTNNNNLESESENIDDDLSDGAVELNVGRTANEDENSVKNNYWGSYKVSTKSDEDGIVKITDSSNKVAGYMLASDYNSLKDLNPKTLGTGLLTLEQAKSALKSGGANADGSSSNTNIDGQGVTTNVDGLEIVTNLGKPGSGTYTKFDKKSGIITERRYVTEVSGGELDVAQSVYRIDYFNNPNAESGAGELKSVVYLNGDNDIIVNLKWNGFNYDCIGSGCDNSLVGERIKNKVNFDHYLTSFRLGLGWGKISSLFGMDDEFSEWKFQVDSFFYKSILLGGSDVWVEHICYMSSDMEGVDNAIFSANEDGLLVQSSAITATKQFIQNPNSTNQWLYRVTYFIRNPEASGSGGFSELLGGSDDDGLIARGSTSTNTEGLSSDEKKLWNIVKKSSEKISNAVGKTSRTAKASDEPIMFNLYFSGERDFWLYDEDQEVDVGDEILYTGSDSFASYSEYNYNQVCIKFTDGEMIDAFYEEHSELCTTIKEVGSSTSYIDIDLETSSSSSSSSSSSTSQRSTF